MKNKKLILAVAALVAVVGLMLGLYFGTRETATEGTKTFTLVVVHGDGSEQTLEITTEQTVLSHALIDEKILTDEGLESGMYLTVDGETSSWEENQSYWAFYVGEDYANAGMNDTLIEAGVTYKLVYTVG